MGFVCYCQLLIPVAPSSLALGPIVGIQVFWCSGVQGGLPSLVLPEYLNTEYLDACGSPNLRLRGYLCYIIGFV